MQKLRATNTNDVVPREYEGRQDFVMWSEIVELAGMLSEPYDFCFDDMVVYYKMRIQKCNTLNFFYFV